MKKFSFKLTAFVAILLAFQVVVSAMRPSDLPQEILELDQQIQAGVDIIYFGDSTLIYPEGESTIPEILRGLLGYHTLGDVAHPAYQLDLYERYVNLEDNYPKQANVVAKTGGDQLATLRTASVANARS